jgi:hypothetical protein
MRGAPSGWGGGSDPPTRAQTSAHHFEVGRGTPSGPPGPPKVPLMRWSRCDRQEDGRRGLGGQRASSETSTSRAGCRRGAHLPRAHRSRRGGRGRGGDQAAGPTRGPARRPPCHDAVRARTGRGRSRVRTSLGKVPRRAGSHCQLRGDRLGCALLGGARKYQRAGGTAVPSIPRALPAVFGVTRGELDGPLVSPGEGAEPLSFAGRVTGLPPGGRDSQERCRSMMIRETARFGRTSWATMTPPPAVRPGISDRPQRDAPQSTSPGFAVSPEGRGSRKSTPYPARLPMSADTPGSSSSGALAASLAAYPEPMGDGPVEAALGHRSATARDLNRDARAT